MPPGKLAAQASHAARLSLLHYLQANPQHAADFRRLNSCGSAIVLAAPSLNDLERVADKAAHQGLPWALFEDSGHVLPPFFDGSPIITALAIGPAEKTRIKPLLRAYECL